MDDRDDHALHLAKASGHTEIVALLESHVAGKKNNDISPPAKQPPETPESNLDTQIEQLKKAKQKSARFARPDDLGRTPTAGR